MNNAELIKHVKEEALQWKDTLAEPGEYNPESVREYAAFQQACSEDTLKALNRLVYLEAFTNKWVNTENGYQDKLAQIERLCTGVTPYENRPFGVHDVYDSVRARARQKLAREILEIVEGTKE